MSINTHSAIQVKFIWCFFRNINMIEWEWAGIRDNQTGIARGQTDGIGPEQELLIGKHGDQIAIVGDAIIGTQISFLHSIHDNTLTAYFDAD